MEKEMGSWIQIIEGRYGGTNGKMDQRRTRYVEEWWMEISRWVAMEVERNLGNLGKKVTGLKMVTRGGTRSRNMTRDKEDTCKVKMKGRGTMASTEGTFSGVDDWEADWDDD
ncbi:hypothetical protein V6N13_143138 [Hibiscus sabdariffa]|uniref:Uncharacterized protein n=1 Tax=Hibiscus sabdariffa TaxID=183260 RepID=A0ABR2FGN3_9ROSI